MTDSSVEAFHAEIRKAHGLSRIFIWFIPVGFALMIASLFEGSITWAAYVCLTGWWGIVMGLNGAGSLKRQLLDPDSDEAKMSWGKRQLWGLFTFWLPTLSAVVLGGLIYNNFQIDHRPRGVIGEPFILIESSAMYFLSAGFAWTGVFAARR